MHHAWQAGISFFKVSFSIKLAASAASGWADTWNLLSVLCPLPSVLCPLLA
jgi:hypothetical protein